MYNNLWYNGTFIFKVTASGVDVYNNTPSYLGSITASGVNSVYATASTLYMATSVSGVLCHPTSSISGGIFNDLAIYKQYPDLTNNDAYYIHGAGDYVLVTTASGVDQYNVMTDTRIYNQSSYEITKCFQTSGGRFYYVTREISDPLYNFGTHKIKIDLTRETNYSNYQVEVILTVDNFDYYLCTTSGSNLRFFDQYYNQLNYWIEDWNLLGTSHIWVKLPQQQTSYFYLVCGYTTDISLSNGADTFDFFDDFLYTSNLSDNCFLPASGTITSSSVTNVSNLYDGDVNTYADFDNSPHGWVKIVFPSAVSIRKLRIYNFASSNDGFYLYASTAGSSWTPVYTCTSTVGSGWHEYDIYTGVPYQYYYLTSHTTTQQWYVGAVEMYSAEYMDVSVSSGSWSYVSDPTKFFIYSPSILTCEYGNYDYILSNYSVQPPVVIEQKIQKVAGANDELGYSNILYPHDDGVCWYQYSTLKPFDIYFNGVAKSNIGSYDGSKGMPSEAGIFSTTIAKDRIKVAFEGATVDFEQYWVSQTANMFNRALKIFGGSSSYWVNLDWVRVRKYDKYNTIVSSINSAVAFEKQYYLNAMYSNFSWDDDSVDHKYLMNEAVVINDLFVSENTSEYGVGNNVLFIATNQGAMIIEERKDDESNSRIKYLKLDLNNPYYDLY